MSENTTAGKGRLGPGGKRVLGASCLALAAFALTIRAWPRPEFFFDLDEMATAAWVLSRGWADLFSQLWSPHEGNAAGYPAIIYLWGKIGQSETFLRLPSMVAGTALLLLLFRRALGSAPWVVALLLSLLGSLSTALLLHSQSARPYALYALFSFLSLHLGGRVLEKRKETSLRLLVAFAAASAISLYLHHFSFFYLGVIWAAWTWHVAKKDLPAWTLGAPLAALLLYLPQVFLLAYQVEHGPRWIPAMSLKRFSLVMEFLVSQPSLPATFLVGALSALGLAVSLRRRHWLLPAWTLLPLLAASLLSLSIRPLLVDRYFLPSAAGALYLGAIGAGFLWERFARARTFLLVVLAAAAGHSLTQLNSLYLPRGPDFRGAVEFLVKNAEECSTQVVTEPLLLRRWPYYLPETFPLHSWHGELPERPFWLLGAGYPVPGYIDTIARESSSLFWEGRNAVAACIREP